MLQNITRTGVRLGSGSYGEVEELCWNGTMCAGKCLHSTLLDQQLHPETSSLMTDKFAAECKMIAQIRHPNIVQFLGLCCFPDDRQNRQRLYLVMERLDSNLYSLLENRPNIKLSVKCQILLDVSRGLVHLHSNSPPIIHRDLTTRNILLTDSMQAKIADLGTARMIASSTPTSQLGLGVKEKLQHTPMPGTPIFMPPEASMANPDYDTKLDVFSFGQVMLHTLTQVFPCELLPPTYASSSGRQIKGRSEVERRERYTDILYAQLQKNHKVCKLMVKCLEDLPSLRPTAKEAMKVLEDVALDLVIEERKHFIQEVDSLMPHTGEGPEAVDGEWDPTLRRRTATFAERQILVSLLNTSSELFYTSKHKSTLPDCSAPFLVLGKEPKVQGMMAKACTLLCVCIGCVCKHAS